VNPVAVALARTEAHIRIVTSASVALKNPGNTAPSVIGALCQTIDATREKFPEKIWDRNLQTLLSQKNQLALPKNRANLLRNGLTLQRSKRK
jgi:hypothetical protein